MRIKRHCFTVLASLSWMATACPARAQSCTISAQGVSFGSYDPFASSDLDGVGNVRVVCDVGKPVQVSLSTGAGGDYMVRRMSSGNGVLAYNLYTDTIRSTVWGDGTGGSSMVAVEATSLDLTVYGTVPARQNPVPGSYTDSIFVTITY